MLRRRGTQVELKEEIKDGISKKELKRSIPYRKDSSENPKNTAVYNNSANELVVKLN